MEPSNFQQALYKIVDQKLGDQQEKIKPDGAGDRWAVGYNSGYSAGWRQGADEMVAHASQLFINVMYQEHNDA